ncbi:hypothetical protein ACOMHN_009104 [Nucella lapillus]
MVTVGPGLGRQSVRVLMVTNAIPSSLTSSHSSPLPPHLAKRNETKQDSKARGQKSEKNEIRLKCIRGRLTLVTGRWRERRVSTNRAL